MKARVCYKLPDRTLITERGQLKDVRAFDNLHWDEHEVEDANAVITLESGVVLITDSNQNYFVYPTHNLLKIEVLDL